MSGWIEYAMPAIVVAVYAIWGGRILLKRWRS